MSKKIVVICSFLIVVLLNTCTENPIKGDDNSLPGRRDYVWTVDTLNIPFTTLQRIWGSSPQDVWAIGPGGDADKTIYHFNGVNWETDGISRPLAPTAIFGFAPDNVWIGGNGGEFWHYDGQNWNKHSTLTIENYPGISIENIWGDSPNNIYAVGFAENSETYKSVIANYDGVKWQNVETSAMRNSFIKIQRGTKTSSNYFVLGIRIEQFFEDTSYIYEFDGVKLNEIYKGLANSNEIGGIENINGEVYFLKGNKIYKYANNTFHLFLNINKPAAIWGRNNKDIILGKLDGIAHYNGTDIQYIYQFGNQGISVFTAAIFEKEIFVLAYDFNNALNLIFRGKLN
ncbi:MAG: hypothetical protein IH949_13445 [Bacteroidetes bacterium]|nr:hypothetical protein [Bacteroidota bacterium]